MSSKYSISRVILAIAPLIILTGAVTGARPALAAATPWVDSDYAQVRLIAAWHGTGLRAGLQFRIDAGWKTYWRSPGDSGIPPRIEWSGSENVLTPVVRYPIPHRVETFGFQTLVYENQVVLPIEFPAAQGAEKLHLRANIDYAVCREICVPMHAELSLEIDPASPPSAADKAHAELIERYAARVPTTAARTELTLRSVALDGPPGRQTLNVVIASKSPLTAPGLIVEAGAPFGFGAPVFTSHGATTLATIGVSGGRSKKSLSGRRLTLTIYDGDVGIERVVVVGASQ